MQPTTCRLLVLLVAVGPLACSRPAPPAAVGPDVGTSEPAGEAAVEAPGDAGSPSPASDGGSAADASTAPAPDAGPPGPPVLPVSAAVAIVGGEERPLATDGVTLVDPAASFRVELAVQVTDGRMALHDEQDAMVVSSGTTELGGSWTRFRLTPEAPLAPGTTYTLQLDGAVSREAHDPAGRAYAPVVVTVKTTGDRPAPKKNPGRKKRR